MIINAYKIKAASEFNSNDIEALVAATDVKDAIDVFIDEYYSNEFKEKALTKITNVEYISNTVLMSKAAETVKEISNKFFQKICDLKTLK